MATLHTPAPTSLSSSSAVCSKEEAAKLAHFTRLRLRDQIVDGVLRYEKRRERSLEFAQAAMASWLSIAAMVAKLGGGGAGGVGEQLDMYYEGLGEGHAFKVRSCLTPRACTDAGVASGVLLEVWCRSSCWNVHRRVAALPASSVWRSCRACAQDRRQCHVGHSPRCQVRFPTCCSASVRRLFCPY